MRPLLYLAHRLPFPPNKGDKIRSFHLLRHLAQRWRVHLGCFVDAQEDLAHVPELARYCASHCALPMNPRLARLKSLRGLLSGEALTLPYYRSAAMQRWVADTVAHENIAHAVVFSSAMAQYTEGLNGVRVVNDFCDVDSAKWEQYSRSHAWPVSWVYGREGERLLVSEREAAARSAACIFVTEPEARLFRELAPEVADKVHAIECGVDTAFYDPRADRASPYAAGEVPIVMTGVMDYWPNIDAATWFARAALPSIARAHPAVRFYIVGMNPAPTVQALSADPRVVVTGKVADVRPWVQHARVVVAPLRVARGVQTKVLEGMALGRPVVVSAASAEAVPGRPGEDYAVATTSQDFIDRVGDLLDPVAGEAMGLRARARILSDCDWDRNLGALDALLEPEAPPEVSRHAR